MKHLKYNEKATVDRNEHNAIFRMEIDGKRYSFSVQSYYKDVQDKTPEEMDEWVTSVIGRQCNAIAERARELGRKDVQNDLKNTLEYER